MVQKPAAEIGAINSTPDSGASFSCRCARLLMSLLTAFGNLASNFGPMAAISGAGFWSVCQGLNVSAEHLEVPLVRYVAFIVDSIHLSAE